ncbi:hypothetical protein AB0L05_35715 [Nonomuraea pusilla]|uniref:hypothetical protein n=1 Tax=Nonomuraea pusilla TaxID=46177 RepID=UPI00331B3403
MIDEIYPQPRCMCGAQAEECGDRCRKCLARDRWTRKRAARKKGPRRGETRRPPRAARGLASMGVTWT